jgi:hypothetical protein
MYRIKFMNSKKGFQPDTKLFKTHEDALNWMRETFEPRHVNTDLIEIVE